jgi:hypothetical protein
LSERAVELDSHTELVAVFEDLIELHVLSARCDFRDSHETHFNEIA